MTIEPNKIATKADCNTIAPGAFPTTDDLTKCPTKAEIKATGVLDVKGTYADNQCVMFSDLAPDFKLSIDKSSVTMVILGGTFTINITSNTSWTVSYPSWCNGPTSGSGNASIPVGASSNAGHPARSGYITIKTTDGSITASCRVNQSGVPVYGGRIHLMVQFANPTPFNCYVAGTVELNMGGTTIGSVKVSGNIPANTTSGQTVGASGMDGFSYSSTEQTVRTYFTFTEWSGDNLSGGAEGTVSGDATLTGEFLGVIWAGSPLGRKYQGNIKFTYSGTTDTYITATQLYTSIYQANLFEIHRNKPAVIRQVCF